MKKTDRSASYFNSSVFYKDCAFGNYSRFIEQLKLLIKEIGGEKKKAINKNMPVRQFK